MGTWPEKLGPLNPGKSVEAASFGRCQRTAHPRQEDQGQGGGAAQGGRAVPADRTAADGAGVAQKKFSAALTSLNYGLRANYQKPRTTVAGD